MNTHRPTRFSKKQPALARVFMGLGILTAGFSIGLGLLSVCRIPCIGLDSTGGLLLGLILLSAGLFIVEELSDSKVDSH